MTGDALLRELRALAADITEAPWQWLDGDDHEPETPGDELQDGRGEMVATGFRDQYLRDAPGRVTDGRFVAALRNAWPVIEAALAADTRPAALDEARLAQALLDMATEDDDPSDIDHDWPVVAIAIEPGPPAEVAARIARAYAAAAYLAWNATTETAGKCRCPFCRRMAQS